MNNLPKVVTQQRRGRASNPRLLNRKSDALPLSHRATANAPLAYTNMDLVQNFAVEAYVVSLLVYEYIGRYLVQVFGSVYRLINSLPFYHMSIARHSCDARSEIIAKS